MSSPTQPPRRPAPGEGARSAATGGQRPPSGPSSVKPPAGARPVPGRSSAGGSAGLPGGAAGAGPRPPGRRRARLVLTRLDPLSTAKVSLVLSAGIGIALVVAVTLLWILFNAAGVFDTVSRTINDIAGSSFDARSYLGFGRVVGVTMLVAALQVVLTTAFATLVAALYNLAAYFVGGLSVTLTEND